MATKTYTIFDLKRLYVPWNVGKDLVEVTKEIVWDESKTNITSAKLSISIRSDAFAVGSETIMNASEVKQFGWAFGEAGDTKTAEVDVSGELRNGNNLFQVTGFKNMLQIKDLNLTISVYVVLSYEGTDPNVEGQYEKYIIPVATTAGIIIFGLAMRKW